jgi:hypothetical protein
VSVFVELWAKTQQLHAQADVARAKDAALRAAGVAMDEATALLRTALATEGDTSRSQVEKAVKVLGEARRRLS